MRQTSNLADGSKPTGPKGQALLLIALGFFVLLGIVGLTTDVGQLLIFMGHLRRATDAASLAAAAQFREGRTLGEMTAAAAQVMDWNGIDPSLYTVTVETCDTTPGDPMLCTTPRRKVVRVTGDLNVPMTFLTLLGVRDIAISAGSIGEAASLDIVLVIDISDSMTWDAPPGNPMRDPAACNAADAGGADGFPGECQPFEEVKSAATAFVNRILDRPAGQEEDRLAIITFANGWSSDVNLGTHYRTAGWTTDNGAAQSIIRNLFVFEPGVCWADEGLQIPAQFYGPCRDYDELGDYQQFDCLSCVYLQPLSPVNDFANERHPIDLSAYTTTNVGGGLLRAGNMFALQTREDALWVVVLLTDGIANATDLKAGDDITDPSTQPLGYCPNEEAINGSWVVPYCLDEDVTSRHSSGNPSYDADDYARDMADFVGCYPINPAAACSGITGQGGVIFTIGLGNGVLDSSNEINGEPYGATLLRYIAAVGYDGDPATDPCSGVSDYTSWCGNYYFAPQGPELTRVFEDIASRIFTRIVH